MSGALTLPVDRTTPDVIYAASLLHALARDEAAGRRPQRLLEPELATWARFKGRLTSRHLLRLLCEDAAVVHKIPFEGHKLDDVPDELIDAWLSELPRLDLKAASADYIAAQAKLLGLPTRLGRSELHQMKPHQRVLELPGTGGQLVHHILTTQPGLDLATNAVIAASTWQELTLAGIVALDFGAPSSDAILSVPANALTQDKHPLRTARFDFVVGLHPDKGGLFRVEDQLAIWFSGAKILLV